MLNSTDSSLLRNSVLGEAKEDTGAEDWKLLRGASAGTLAYYLLYQGLCPHHSLLSSCAAKIGFNREVHVPLKSHPSCQREASRVKLKSPCGLCGVHVDNKMILICSSKEIINI